VPAGSLTEIDKKMKGQTSYGYIAPGGREYAVSAGILAGLNANSRILEIGCGFGVTACNLAETFKCKVTAIDISKDNIAVAKAIARERNLQDGVQFIVGDADRLDFPVGSIDFVVAEGGILTAIKDRKRILQNLIMLIKPDKYLYITDLVVHPYASKAIMNFYGNLNYASEKLYRDILGQNNLKILLCGYMPLMAWNDYINSMPMMLKEKIGFFSHPRMRQFISDEMDVYHNNRGNHGIDYIFLVAKKSA